MRSAPGATTAPPLKNQKTAVGKCAGLTRPCVRLTRRSVVFSGALHVSDLFGDVPASPRLCREDNSRGSDRPARSVRWVTGGSVFRPEWGRTHYTEGHGYTTACGLEVPLFRSAGNVRREEGVLAQVDCTRCRAAMRSAGLSGDGES